MKSIAEAVVCAKDAEANFVAVIYLARRESTGLSVFLASVAREAILAGWHLELATWPNFGR